MKKLLCIALLCLLLAGVLGCGERPVEDSFEEEFTETITKIDLSAPGNQKYREWLEACFADNSFWRDQVRIEPSSTDPKTNRPDIKESKDAWSHLIEESYSAEGLANESWKTWDWNGIWELELYSYQKNEVGWDVLRARDKATGETQMIGETVNGLADSWGSFDVVHIDEAFVVYSLGSDGWSYGFFTPGQSEVKYIGQSDGAGFLDEARTKWWYREYDYGQNDDDSYPPKHLVHYTDLRKMAAGDADAQREVLLESQYYCTNGWMAERNGQSVACFGVSTWNPEGNCWWDPLYLAFYNPLEDQTIDYLEVPPLGWDGMVRILPDKFYFFDLNQAKAYCKKGDQIDWDRAEALGLGGIEFYVINI